MPKEHADTKLRHHRKVATKGKEYNEAQILMPEGGRHRRGNLAKFLQSRGKEKEGDLSPRSLKRELEKGKKRGKQEYHECLYQEAVNERGAAGYSHDFDFEEGESSSFGRSEGA